MRKRAIVAGHICLDIFPFFENPPADPHEFFAPGNLFSIESTLFSTGGAVANTGGALSALGVDTRLVARVGTDGFGAQIRSILEQRHPNAKIELKLVPSEGTSYSIIMSSPRFDRIFFHYSGVNDSFTAADVEAASLVEGDLFHFGYPPAMRGMYENDGEELLRLFSRAKSAGLTTSLDLSYPRPGSRAALADWRRILARVLPAVDIFSPGLGELRLMLSGRAAEGAGDATTSELRRFSAWVHSHGCPVCVLKIGADGLYVRTSKDRSRIEAMGNPAASETWVDRELLEPCFVVEAKGTTGAGDVTIAGFLASVLKGLSLDETTRMALGAGAASVEAVDPTAGLPGWDGLKRRVQAGWARAARRISLQVGG